MEYTGLARSTFAKPHIRELLTKYEYASGDNAVVDKRNKAKQKDTVAEKDRQIAELRVKNADLEKE